MTNTEFPGLERYRLVDDEAATFHAQFTLYKEVDLNTLDVHSSRLTEPPKGNVICFWTMRLGSSTYKIYVGKTNALRRRLFEYSSEFQVHSPNDYKLRIFQRFICSQAPSAAFDLYYAVETDQGFT